MKTLHITLEDLIPLRDFMNEKQLERYADYLLRNIPEEPFTEEEIRELWHKKSQAMNEMNER